MSTSLSRSIALALVPGPVWRSFEQFRKGGTTALEEIPEHGVATLWEEAPPIAFCMMPTSSISSA